MKGLKLDEHTGLVLEGGGMRGVFTCGVLDPSAWSCQVQ